MGGANSGGDTFESILDILKRSEMLRNSLERLGNLFGMGGATLVRYTFKSITDIREHSRMLWNVRQ